MNLKEAFQIVLDLAEQNVLSNGEVGNDYILQQNQIAQQEAVELVQRYAVTNIS